MKKDLSICVAYVAAKLISGKKILHLYDCSMAERINTSDLASPMSASPFASLKKVYLPGSPRTNRYRYSFDNGQFIEITINGTSFIGVAKEGDAHFVGNVKGDAVYVYDQERSSHFNYRIIRCAVDHYEGCSLCEECLIDDEEGSS